MKANFIAIISKKAFNKKQKKSEPKTPVYYRAAPSYVAGINYKKKYATSSTIYMRGFR